MTFYTFMIRNYLGSDTPEGDLAGDMKRDKERFPRNGTGKFKEWHDILFSHLVREGACPECLDTFEGCWKEYELCEKKRLNRHW